MAEINTRFGGERPEQPPLARHDASVLDLAFAMDCTGSMGSYIDAARRVGRPPAGTRAALSLPFQSIHHIVEAIVTSEKSRVCLGLVEYRDHPPQDATFVTRSHNFTDDVAQMRSWLDQCAADGGGDTPEAVADAIFDLTQLSWREEATKIAVLISDAPPHGLCPDGDGFPNGCPAGHDPVRLCRRLTEMGVTLYVVGCEPSLAPYKDFFAAMAYLTGGQYVPLTNADLLSQVIIGGAQEEITLQRLMESVNQEVQQQYADLGGDVDEEDLARAVHDRLRLEGASSKKLVRNGMEMGVSSKAMGYAKYADFAGLQAEFRASAPSEMPMPSMAYSMSSRRAYAPAAFGAEDEMMVAGAATPMEANVEGYAVQEDEVSAAQVQRMVNRAKAKINRAEPK